MNVTPELLLEQFRVVLAENYFLRLRVEELQQQLAAATRSGEEAHADPAA